MDIKNAGIPTKAIEEMLSMTLYLLSRRVKRIRVKGDKSGKKFVLKFTLLLPIEVVFTRRSLLNSRGVDRIRKVIKPKLRKACRKKLKESI